MIDDIMLQVRGMETVVKSQVEVIDKRGWRPTGFHAVFQNVANSSADSGLDG
jgi:hypothetical protein